MLVHRSIAFSLSALLGMLCVERCLVESGVESAVLVAWCWVRSMAGTVVADGVALRELAAFGLLLL